MLRYKTKTRPGLVTLYDIRPGNEAGPFLQPQSPHGAFKGEKVNSQGTGAYCVGLPHSLFFLKFNCQQNHLNAILTQYSTVFQLTTSDSWLGVFRPLDGTEAAGDSDGVTRSSSCGCTWLHNTKSSNWTTINIQIHVNLVTKKSFPTGL